MDNLRLSSSVKSTIAKAISLSNAALLLLRMMISLSSWELALPLEEELLLSNIS